jgi:hypothetical protein
VDALAKEQCGASVPQIVEAHRWQLGTLQQRCERPLTLIKLLYAHKYGSR